MVGMSEPIVSVSGLTVDFFVDGEWSRAVSDVSYQVMPGEVLAVVGESGSGKSTTALTLIGLLPPTARATGSVVLRGKELVGVPQSQLRSIRGVDVGMVFQEPMSALNPVLTVGFQIVEALRAHDQTVTLQAAGERARELLSQVELPDPEKAFHSYPHQLSGGQRQRAMIAQALSQNPALLIADEPTSALDVTVQAEILDLLRKLSRRLGQAVLLITHDMGVVADLADRVIVMKDGHVVEENPVETLYATPTHPYTKSLLESVPFLGRGTRRSALPPSAPLISAAGLCIDYPKRGRVPAFRAATDLDFVVGHGEVVGIVGESGSGKTTVARAVLGLLPLAAGELVVDGVSMADVKKDDLRALRRRMGIVFQDPGASLNPRWPIGQSIAEPLELAQWSGMEVSNRVSELLELVELPTSLRNRYPHELSGGQRQRIGVARALALNPVLVVADEPTSALDVSVQARVLELFLKLQEQLGFSALFISHDLAIVEQIAHRIVVMSEGLIVEHGPTANVLDAPAHPYTKKLLNAVPVPDPVTQRGRRENIGN